ENLTNGWGSIRPGFYAEQEAAFENWSYSTDLSGYLDKLPATANVAFGIRNALNAGSDPTDADGSVSGNDAAAQEEMDGSVSGNDASAQEKTDGSVSGNGAAAQEKTDGSVSGNDAAVQGACEGSFSETILQRGKIL
ncbi:MAG: hypothetical protein K2O06_08755, partial [Acetatifactor sp.]|nr:hypothetical protein [Acetatifactor sp.]